jgi:hypothetical protein
VTVANVNEIPTERLKDYASTVKDVLDGERDGDSYATAAEAQAVYDSFLDYHNELRDEHNRRKELKECPSNESISSLGSLCDHQYTPANFRDPNNEPVHYTETEGKIQVLFLLNQVLLKLVLLNLVLLIIKEDFL